MLATKDIKIGDMVFFVDGGSAIGAVREIADSSLSTYVENAGEFHIPFSAIGSVHSHKVILIHKLMTEEFLLATRHAHDDEHDAE